MELINSIINGIFCLWTLAVETTIRDRRRVDLTRHPCISKTCSTPSSTIGRKAKAKVALVNLGDGRTYNQIDECSALGSVGIEIIAAFLEQNGFRVCIVDQSADGLTNNDTAQAVVDFEPDILGLNPLNNHRHRVGQIVESVKARLPNVFAVIGGYDATFNRLSIYHKAVDAIVRGQGEIALHEIAKRLQVQTSLHDIQGVAYRTQKGTVEKIGELASGLPVNKLPIPRRQNLDALAQRNETVSITASRGCWAKCKFCSTPQMYPNGREERPLKDVKTEIDQLIESGVRRFSFWDEDFYGTRQASIARTDGIIQHIRAMDGRITFSFISAPGIFMAEKFGCLQRWENVVERVYCGVEGGCDAALKNLGNMSCLKQSMNAQALAIMKNYNIGLQIGFIMFNPYSTFEELRRSAGFLRETGEVNCVSFFHRLRPYPGTRIYSELQESGLLLVDIAEAQFDLHQTIAYRFIDHRVGDLAEALASAENDIRTGELDRLNIEIMSEVVKLGSWREVLSDDPIEAAAVNTYRELRHETAELNYRFFWDSLYLFEQCGGHGFSRRVDRYSAILSKLVKAFRDVKSEISEKEPIHEEDEAGLPATKPAN